MTKKNKKDEKWKVKVDKSVYDRLSRGTYDTLAKGLKELVSNSYDSDALNLKIAIEDDKSRIHLYDDGKGMSVDDFSDFVRLGGRQKRTANKEKGDIDKDTTELSRKKIGWMGIGNLAIAEYVDDMEVTSTMKGNLRVLYAVVGCKEYFQPGEATDIEVLGESYDNETDKEEQYTKITLQLNEKGRNQLDGSLEADLDRGPHTMKIEDKMSNLTKFKWELERICPLIYRNEDEEFKILEKENIQPMKVTLNNRELRRTVARNLKFDSLQDKGYDHYVEGKLNMSYKIGWNKKIIPMEAKGVLTRVKNVAIGIPHDFGVSNRTRHIYRSLDWISGEVIIHNGLDDDLDTSREKFQRRTDEYHLYYKRMQKIIEGVAKSLQDLGEYDAKIKKLNRELSSGKKAKIKIEKAVNKILKDRKASIPVTQIEKKIRHDTSPILPDIPKKLGYEVIKRNEKGEKAIEVDHAEKKILINLENECFTKDRITIRGEIYFIRPGNWDYQPDDPDGFCIFRKKKKVKLIFLNRKHPLYKAKDKEIFIWLKYAQLASKQNPGNMLVLFQDLYLALK